MKSYSELVQLQPNVLMLLENSMKKNRLAHAYIFEGGHGTGKREIALQLTKLIFCENVTENRACNCCSSCVRIEQQSHPDVHLIEPEGQSIRKEQMKYLHAEFRMKSVESGYKVYVIDHAEKMTLSAANSLLKYIEEPAPNTKLILLTTLIHQVIPTIISRCQVISFRQLDHETFCRQLISEGVSQEVAPLLVNITNNVEEALALFEDDWFTKARRIVVKLYKVIKEPFEAIVLIQEEWVTHFKERKQIELGLDMLLFLCRDVLLARTGRTSGFIFASENRSDDLAVTDVALVENIEKILLAKRKLQANMNPQLLMEQLVIQFRLR